MTATTAPSMVSRIVVGVLALVLIFLVGRVSMANVIARANPASALSLYRGQPAALAASAYDAISPTPSVAGAKRAIALAGRALRLDPMSATAATNLGLAYEIAGDRARAARLVDYSERLSRRNLVAQLWLIEAAVAKNDIALALRHYDVALRTSDSAPTLLFGVLVSATGDDAILGPLARVLAQRPPWAEQYTQQLVQSGTNLGNIGKLAALMNRRGAPIADRALATLIDRQVAARQFDDAWALYAAYRPGADRRALRNGDFTAAPATPTAFDWTFPDEGGASADIRDGALYLDASAAAGGTVARQLLMLTPGAHRVVGVISNVPELGDNAPYLQLTCAGVGNEVSRRKLPTAGEKSANVVWDVMVPAGCATQTLAVVLQPVDTPGGIDARIDRLSLAR